MSQNVGSIGPNNCLAYDCTVLSVSPQQIVSPEVVNAEAAASRTQ